MKLRPSIVYSVSQKRIIYKGTTADQVGESNRYQDDYCYVHNVFMELYAIYQEAKGDSYTYDLHSRMVTDAVKIYLQDVIQICQTQLERTPKLLDNDYHYAMILPTSWKVSIDKTCSIGEAIIRPLFIEANIIDARDDYQRLLFLTTLNSNFRYIQFLIRNRNDSSLPLISNGKQYIMCTLEFVNNEQHIDLDLFAAHYPLLPTTDNNYDSQSLMSSSSIIPLSTQSTEEDIKFCLSQINVTVGDTCLIDKLAKYYAKMCKVKKKKNYCATSNRRFDLYFFLESIIRQLFMLPERNT